MQLMWQKILAQIQIKQTKIACKFLKLITKKQYHIEIQEHFEVERLK